ncbi:MAG: hypothetical protein Q9225_007380 [Loekoesia sp. 1 TL-2023]
MLSHPAFAYDEKNDIFYSGFAGRVSNFGNNPDAIPLSLWSFKPDGTGSGTWKEEIGSDDPAFNHLIRPFEGYQAYGGDGALVLGGLTSAQSDEKTKDMQGELPSPGLVTLNMTTKTFTNSSAESFNGKGDAVEGQIHYVPSFGPNGLFMIMGGSKVPAGNNSLLDFSNIWVYESATKVWFNQTATGNIPESRRAFCIAGLNSTDGTYEIFVYGGQNGDLGTDTVPYDEIFILTLPAFHWLKVDYPPAHPRHGHTCNAVGGSQIISIGGVDSNSHIYSGIPHDIATSTFNSSTDPFAQGLGIFDMTTLTWTDHYIANAPPYKQSDLVKSFYTQNPQDAPPAASNPSPAPASTTSTTSSSHTGAIAGGVVGGVVGLALIAGMVFFLFRRRRGRYSKPTGSSTPKLNGNKHLLQQVDGGHTTEYYGGGKGSGRGYHEWSQHQPAELEESRPEMGHDEQLGTVEKPSEMEEPRVEMEAREAVR